MPTAMRGPSAAAGAGRSSRLRMSTVVTTRPRRFRRPAISGGANGTRAMRSGTNTSCTRAIGRPNSWPPMVAVTYSVSLSPEAAMTDPLRRAIEFGGLLLERRNQALAIEFRDIVIEADLAPARDGLGGHQRRQPD